MLRLRIERGGPKDKAYALAEGVTILGRSKTKADIQMGCPDVSRQHTRIHVTGGQATAENLSQYGTYIDQQLITAPTPLKPGQRLQLGGHTVLLVEQMEEPTEPVDDFDLLSRADIELPRDIISRSMNGSLDTDTNTAGNVRNEDDVDSFPGGAGR
jgi:pSer/pThr/pTyr-binding forkhead associated (FHA) protein